MNDNIMLSGFIEGMTKVGCRFIKLDQDKIYFEVPPHSEKEMKSAKKIFNSQGIRLFTKINNELSLK